MACTRRKLNIFWGVCSLIIVSWVIFHTTSPTTFQTITRPFFLTYYGQPLADYDLFYDAEGNSHPSCECRVKHAQKKIAQWEMDAFDTSISWLNETTKDTLKEHHPNLPVSFLYELNRDGGCDLIPTQFSIHWKNRYWQETKLAEGVTFLLYSATYDLPKGNDSSPHILLLGVSETERPPFSWCHLWFSTTSPPMISKAKRVDHLDYQYRSSSRQMPFLVSCEVPSAAGKRKPKAVSLVDQPCRYATNLLRVTGSRERSNTAYADGISDPHRVTGWTAAVCGPALYYFLNDFSARLVEWLEVLKAEGISRVFLYETDVHPNMKKVLQYYQHSGFVHVTKYSYPPPYINEPSMRRLWTMVERSKMFAQENIYFTDCLLRHMHEYRFIAHYDPDEIPILSKHGNFTNFLDYLLTKNHKDASANHSVLPIGYRLQWKFYDQDMPPTTADGPENLPDYLWALRHAHMSPKETPPYTVSTSKVLYDMNSVRGVYSHGVLVCTTGRCSSNVQTVTNDIAHLGHFTGCSPKCMKRSHSQDGAPLLKHKDKVKSAVSAVLKELDLL